jgi:hypothetical protein
MNAKKKRSYYIDFGVKLAIIDAWFVLNRSPTQWLVEKKYWSWHNENAKPSLGVTFEFHDDQIGTNDDGEVTKQVQLRRLVMTSILTISLQDYDVILGNMET